ncbi:hypothetical protein BJX96DRAFT_141939, partial [Aspergillus floccosus]
MIAGQVHEVISPTSYPSRLNLGKVPSNGVTAVSSHAVAPLPAAGNLVVSNATGGMNRAPSPAFLALTTPNHLVMADFDFEQSFINDIAPLGQSYGYSDTFSEVQPGGPTSTELDWLESLLGGEQHDSPERIPGYR